MPGTTPAPDSAAVIRHLRRLAVAYPAFDFGYELVNPRRGKRWVAERRDRLAPGTRVVITASLMELHAALQPYKAASHDR